MHELHQSHTNGAPSAIGTTEPIYVRGKFLFCGEQKFYIKGVTYGTFEPREDNILFPEKHIIERDFAMMARHGLNCVRTYTVPPRYLLDIAASHGLYVMVGLPWEQHLTFLEDQAMPVDIIRRVREGVIECQQHPAILCYAIGNEIPADIVRWYGKEKIESFIHTLYNTVKRIDPDRLVTYVNFPTTEYLDLGFLDFDCYNVYLESQDKLSAYLARLHNLSKDRPLVLAEIGLDSQRNGVELQAEILTWQIQTIFSKGCAGMFVFGWTDEWWRGGFQIEDWDFGIVDRDRRPKPALHAVAQAMRKVPVPDSPGLPFISVVVCSYNGSRTIRDTMEGLQQLHYPHFEVIVINDGSTDNLADIVREYPVSLISTPNRGLSCARNTGMYYAKGEIIAYIDDDAYPDPHWLDYLAYAYSTSDHGCIGGPNLAPDDDGPIATCVANAPGGPVHVLISDEIAEHVPGCNLSVKRDVLMEIGGFDPIYRSAGDDVDVCWRIQQAGYTIGFHPSALVWHHRRNSLRTYWKQQIGYGKAEALLESKWPEKYNGFGHLSWAGRIYGNGLTMPLPLQKEKIFHGTWGSALFQSVYQPADGFLRSIPLMPEWYLLTGMFAIVGIFGFIWSPLLMAWPLFAMSIALVVLQAAISSKKNASLTKAQKKNYKYRLLIIALHVVQPVARLYGRFKHGLTPWRIRRVEFNSLVLFVFGKHVFTLWSEKWKSSEAWLSAIEYNLKNSKVRVRRGGDFDNWDIQVRSGLYSSSRGLLAIEEHGAGKQMLKLKCTTQYGLGGYALAAALCAISIVAAMSGELLVAAIFWMMFAVAVFRFLMETAGCLNTLQAGFLALQTTEHEETIREPWIEQMKSSKAFELVTEEVMGESVADVSMAQPALSASTGN
jgi:glycosyltransferase involved in cell wall biosynthesis